MGFELLYVIFVVVAVLNYILQDIKINKIKKESLDKDKVIGSLMAHNQVLRKLNAGFKDHERRINDIEEHLSLSREPEKPEEPEYTCKDCKYYHPFNGIGFADAVKYFECEKTGHCFSREQIGTCQLFEKKESIDEDEDADEDVVYYYANNVKVDISSKAPHVVYKTDGLLPEEYANLVSKLYYSD